MAVTSRGIVTPNQTDEYKLVTDLNTMATSIDEALQDAANTYRGTSTQRTQFTSQAPEGTIWVDTNGEKIVWVKQGVSWRRIWPVEQGINVLRDGNVFPSVASGVSLLHALAVTEQMPGTNLKRVSWQASSTGLSRTAGTQNTTFGTLAPELHPDSVEPVAGAHLPGASTLNISTSGSVSLRWSATAGSGFLYMSASYFVET